MDLVEFLRKRTKLRVRDRRVDPAPGSFDPVGVLVHHTAGRDSLDIVRHGRSDLPGPLCNFLIAKDGTVYVITDGKANDSGNGSGVVLERVKADKAPRGDAGRLGLSDTVNGNPYFYDIEVENLGDGRDPYPRKQKKALVRVCAELCWKYGWSHRRVVHHREWTARKIDMSYRGPLRTRVRLVLMRKAYKRWLRR